MLVLVSKTGLPRCLSMCIFQSHIFHELWAHIVYQFLESCTDCMWRFKNPLLDHRVLEPTDPWPSQAGRREERERVTFPNQSSSAHSCCNTASSISFPSLSLFFPQTALSSFFQESNIPSHHQMVSVFSMEKERRKMSSSVFSILSLSSDGPFST